MKTRQFLFALSLLLAPLSGCGAETTAVHVTVKTEEGQPVPEAEVIARFRTGAPNNLTPSPRGLTESNGKISLSGSAEVFVTVEAKKDGYYPSRIPDLMVFNQVAGRRVYRDQNIDLVLRPIRNPVKMYYWRRLTLPLPENGKPTGLDLEAGEWVAPLGKGSKVDVYLTSEETKIGADNWTCALTISFPRPTDGIIPFPMTAESAFKSPYAAPTTGYLQVFKWGKSQTATPDRNGFLQYERKNDVKADQGYIFRVRSETDAEGKILRAYYGKLLTSPEIGEPGPVPRSIILDYLYLNPTPNDRNLEFKVGDALNQQKETLYPDLP